MDDATLIKKYISKFWESDTIKFQIYLFTPLNDVKERIMDLIIDELISEIGVTDRELIKSTVNSYANSIRPVLIQ